MNEHEGLSIRGPKAALCYCRCGCSFLSKAQTDPVNHCHVSQDPCPNCKKFHMVMRVEEPAVIRHAGHKG